MLSNCVKALRKFFKISQAELAAMSGISQSSLSEIENYKTGCSVYHALCIYNAFEKVILSNSEYSDIELLHLEEIFYFDEEA